MPNARRETELLAPHNLESRMLDREQAGDAQRRHEPLLQKIRGTIMLRVLVVIFMCLSTLSAVCQTASKYQVATITAVKPHQTGDNANSDATSYEVSLKVEGTVYVVLYKPPLGMNTVQYAAGRALLVLVGEKTITYNDIMGRSFEVPIVNRKPATDAKQSE
jgi:hypothetical protein